MKDILYGTYIEKHLFIMEAIVITFDNSKTHIVVSLESRYILPLLAFHSLLIVFFSLCVKNNVLWLHENKCNIFKSCLQSA